MAVGHGLKRWVSSLGVLELSLKYQICVETQKDIWFSHAILLMSLLC